MYYKYTLYKLTSAQTLYIHNFKGSQAFGDTQPPKYSQVKFIRVIARCVCVCKLGHINTVTGGHPSNQARDDVQINSCTFAVSIITAYIHCLAQAFFNQTASSCENIQPQSVNR